MATVKMIYKKSTKGTVVYENADSEVCTSIYIKKGALKGTPKTITLTIEEAEGE